MADRSLQIQIILRDLVSRGVTRLQRGMRGLRNTINATSNAAFGLKGALAGLGIGLLARSFIKSADQAEQLRMRLNILLGDVERGNDLFKKAADYAGSVGHEYLQLMEAATTLAGVVEGSNEDIMEWTRIVSDVAAAANISIEQTTSNIVRMFSAGAASADLFREKGVLSMLGFTAGVSYSAEETRRTLLEMFRDPESALRGSAQRMASTWKGLMSMLADHWEQFKQAVMGKGVFSSLKAYAQAVLDKLNQLKAEGQLDVWAKKMSDAIVVNLERVVLVASLVHDAFRGWQMIWQGLKIAFAVLVDVVSRGLEKLTGWIAKVLGAYQKLLQMQAWIADKAAKLEKGMQAIADPYGFMTGRKTFMGWLAADTEIAIHRIDNLKQSLGGVNSEGNSTSDWAQELLDQSIKQLEVLVAQESSYSRAKKLLQELRDLQEKWAKEKEEELPGGGGVRPGTEDQIASLKAQLQAELGRFKANQQLIEAQLDSSYERGLITMQEYFDERERLIREGYAKELELAEKRLEDPDLDADKRLQVQTEIYQLEKERERELTRLALERFHAQEAANEASRDAAKLIDQIKQRVSQIGEFGLASQFQTEIRDMEHRQREEMDRLIEMRKQQIDVDAELQEAHRQHQLERERLLQDQKWRLQQEYLNRAKQSFGFIEQAMADAYEASGEKIKEFYYIQRGAAIAQTIISTYQAAQEAYKALAGIPVVGPALGAAAAGTAIAAGMARVAKISNTDAQFAEGGEVKANKESSANSTLTTSGGKVKGSSPHPKADNIFAALTANEYVQPVDVVRHYGLPAMEAIRKKLVPRELLAGFVGGTVRSVSNSVNFTTERVKMAEGGLVQGVGRSLPAGNSGEPTNVSEISMPITVNQTEKMVRLLRDQIEQVTISILDREFA